MLPLPSRQECRRLHVCALGWVGNVCGGELMPVRQFTGENHLETEGLGQGTLMLHSFPQRSVVASQK